MRAHLAAIAIAALAAPTTASADRLAPPATQRAVLGCWELGAGVTLHLAPFGKHSVDATARFQTRPRGGPRRIRARGVWEPAAAAYAVPCQPRSQHGSVCLVRPEAGGLRVDVISFGFGGRVRGVTATVLARRCRQP